MDDSETPDGSTDEPAGREAVSNAEIFREIVELEGYLDHLNDMYGRALSVSPGWQGPDLARNLLERAEGHLTDLQRLLNAVHGGQIPETRHAEWRRVRRDTTAKIIEWMNKCRDSLRSSRPNDDLGIEARVIGLSARWDLESLLTQN